MLGDRGNETGLRDKPARELLTLLRFYWPQEAGPELFYEVERRLAEHQEAVDNAKRRRCSACGDIADTSGRMLHYYGCRFATRDNGGPWPNMGEKL